MSDPHNHKGFSFKKILKQLDFFKVPVSLFLHRTNRKTDEKNQHYLIGTTLGGVVSCMMFVFLLSMFVNLVVDMYSCKNDSI